MAFIKLSTALLVLLSAYGSAEVPEGAAAVSQDVAVSDRVLRAATKRSDLFRRSMRVHKRHEAELSYIEGENGWSNEPVFASQVKVGSHQPILNLEEVEHFLQDLECGPGSMKLHFVDQVTTRDAMDACAGGLVITSHQGCNAEGVRSVYKVKNVGVANDGLALDLDVVESKWNDAFSQFDIAFGHTTDSHLYRRHADFDKIRKRQERASNSTTPNSSASNSSASALRLPGGFLIPSNTSDDVNTVTLNLTSERLDSVFNPADFRAGLENITSIPDIPDLSQLPLEIGCKNCSTSGSVVLNQGLIKIDLSQIDLVPDFLQGGDDGKSLLSVISGGFFELVANGVGAHIELFARPKLNGSFDVTVFSLPTPAGFVIPGIGRAGVTFDANLAVEFDLVKPGIEINYGFDITVPDKSSVRLDLTNFTGSGIVGFPDTKLTPMPVSVNISDFELVASATLNPTIPIGFQFLENLEASISVALDLPRLDLRLATEQNADCNNLSRGNSTAHSKNGTHPAIKSNATAPSAQPGGSLAELGTIFLVESNISLSIGVAANLQFPLLPPGLNSLENNATVFETTFALANTCIPLGKGAATTGGVTASIESPPTRKTSASQVTATGKPYHPSVSRSIAFSNSTGIWTRSSTNLPPGITAPPQNSAILGTGAISGTGSSAPLMTQGSNGNSSASPIEFTGSASLQLYMPGSAWQFCLLGIGAIAGAMLVL